MPSGWSATLPADTLLDSGVLSIGATAVAVSRGGISFTEEPEWRNVDFDGRRAPIVGLDRKVGIVARFAGVFLNFAHAHILIYEAQKIGSLSATGQGAPALSVAQAAALSVAAAAAYTCNVPGVIEGAQGLLSSGRYLSDLRLTYQRGGGGDVRVIFPKAKCTKYDLKGKDKEEAEVSAEFEARLDMSVAADTDVMPYYIEVR
jgi:hypothetical protein